MRFGMSEEEFKWLETILLMPLKDNGATVWIFGSRARGDQKPFSDIDILYKIGSALPKGFLFDLKTKLDESRLPYKVDLVNEDQIANSYRDSILKERKLLF